ncbi:hypothetical protein SLE2022_278280 [Rubroshorea leprosula]
MRTRKISTTILCNHMLQILFPLNPNKPHIKQVCSCFFSLFLTKHHFTSFIDPSLSSSSSHQIKPTQIDLSSIDCTGIAKSVILRCPHVFDRKEKSFANASLKDFLLELSNVVPETARRFRRFTALKPGDVLEILLGFQFDYGKVVITARTVEALWGIFKWASNQDQGFKHLPRSFEVMASMLIQAGMVREVELLLTEMERQGTFLDNNWIFSNLMEACISIGDVETAISVFDKMMDKRLVLPLSCCRALIDVLVTRKRTELAFQVCSYMVGIGVHLSEDEKRPFENALILLCREGRIHEARHLLKKVMASGFGPSSIVINEIACGYCEKKDFEDLLKFLVEMKQLPDVMVGNKIIHTLCSNFGIERADLFRQELEHFGFRPDEITFGILIGWSCHDGNLRDAFIYLSEVLSRDLKPDIFSYNAIISAMFEDGLWKHVQDILDEMVERGTEQDFLTFKVLLAGYCKARRFDEVKMIVCQMANRGLIELSSLGDPLSRAFMILGLNPSAVRLRRDNEAGFSRAEFFDNLGNGLYLDTDLDEYDQRVTEILKDSRIPDFTSLVMKECAHENFRTALEIVDKMVWWGQELPLSVFSELVKETASSRSHIKLSTSLLKKMPKLANQLDQETCNFLVQSYCNKGLTLKAGSMFYEMLQKDLTIKSETYTALIKGLCKKGTLKDLCDCWDIARNNKWLPALKDCKDLLEHLCCQGMVKEALELLESMYVSYPNLRLEILHIFLDKFSITGFTSIAHALVEELLQHGCILDHVAYSHLLRGFCNEKKFSLAFVILDAMMTNKLAPSLGVSAALLPQPCHFDKFRETITLTDTDLEEKSALSSIYTASMKVFCIKGKLGEAEDLFRFLCAEGLTQDAEVYNTMFQAFCQARNLKKSELLLGVMIRKNMNLSVSSFRNWVSLMCTVGRHFHAINLQVFMPEQSKSYSPMIYNILIYHLLSAGKSLTVNKVLNELQRRGLPLDEVTYNFLVHGFSKCGDVSSSLYYLFTMISKGLMPSSRCFRIAITCLCDNGDLGKALELSRDMESRCQIHGSVVQNAIAGGLLSLGKFKEAENFLDRMVGKGLVPDSINYDNLIKQFCSYGRMSKAVDLLNIMLKKGNPPNSSSYDALIQGFCTSNKLNQALDFHTEMLDMDLQPSIKTWEMLVNHFCQDKHTTEAEELLNLMVHLGQTPTRKMYNSIISSYRSESNIKKASELMQMMQQNGYSPDFDTQWSLISNLSNSKGNNNHNKGFLSRLLSGSGFAWKSNS